MSPSQEGLPASGAARTEPGHGGGQDDQGKGTGKEVKGDEGQHAKPTSTLVVDGALADPSTASTTMAITTGLYAIQQPVIAGTSEWATAR